MPTVSMTVNGKAVTGDVEPRTLLVQFLRENLRLTGTHVGCDTSQCGACIIHIDGIAAKACTTLALQCEGAKITTNGSMALNDIASRLRLSEKDGWGAIAAGNECRAGSRSTRSIWPAMTHIPGCA